MEKPKTDIEALQREVTQYREGFAQIASHVDLHFGDRPDVQATVSAICEAIDRLGGQDNSPPEPGSEVRPLSADVRQIKLDGAANLTIVQGPTPSLTIQCKDKSYLPKILTTVSGRALTIDTEPTFISQVGGVTTIIKGAVQQFNGSILGGVSSRNFRIGGQADIELLSQVWPYFPHMFSDERAFLAGLSLTCQLHRNADDRESIIACLRRAAADPSAILPKDFDHSEAPGRLERMLVMSPAHP